MRRKKKIGLALSGGAARGMAHIGVLEVLERENIPVDIITGTSAGAMAGALYAKDGNCKQIRAVIKELSRHKLASFIDPSLPRSGFIKGRRIKDLMAKFIGKDLKFSDLKIPFACVATDINTGEEVVLNEGSVPEAVRASISIPGIFTVVKMDNRYLVDGGLVNPVPVSVAREMGADLVIAVNVIPPVARRIHKEEKKRKPV